MASLRIEELSGQHDFLENRPFRSVDNFRDGYLIQLLIEDVLQPAMFDCRSVPGSNFWSTRTWWNSEHNPGPGDWGTLIYAKCMDSQL